MPKIRNQQFKIAGKGVDIPIYYSNKDQFFYFKFPEWFNDEITRLGNFHNYHSTEASLLQKFNECIRNYHDYIQKRRKVIAYT